MKKKRKPGEVLWRRGFGSNNPLYNGEKIIVCSSTVWRILLRCLVQ
jgi:hypothetical protein